MPYVAAAIMTVIYLMNVPVVFAFVLENYGYGTGFRVFSPRGALKAAQKRARGRKKHINYQRVEKETRRFISLRRMLGIILRLVPKVRVESVESKLMIGTGDAALTALTVGLANAALGTLTAVGRGSAEVRADFFGAHLEGFVRVTVSVKSGQALRAFIDEFRS